MMEEEISNFEKERIKSMEQEFRNSIELPEYEKILLLLHSMFLVTGQLDIMFCNSFLNEALQLLKNSIILYKDGIYDCAFYSVRQACEVINSMLYLSKSPSEKRKEWASKKYFPVDSKLKVQLEKISLDYKEIKSLIPEYFARQEELIKLSHKIIHKQGLDTFYQARRPYSNTYGFEQEKEAQLFVETLKYTIGILLIVFIILDPMSLVLTDDKVTLKVNMNLMTEPINTGYFEEYLGLSDIIDKIKSSEFYQSIVSGFDNYEEMTMATYNVVREEFWDVESLDEIEKQLHLIAPLEKVMFLILKNGIKVSNFYICGGLGWYLTSIKSNKSGFSYNSEEFNNYKNATNQYNQTRKNVFISVVKMYDDDSLFIEHNEPLVDSEISFLKSLEEESLNSQEKFCSFLMSFI